MHCCVIFADVDVHLEWLLLKESDVEIVNFIFEAELGLKVGLETFTHLGGLSRVVVEVQSAEGDQGSVGCGCDVSQAGHSLHHVLVKFSIFDLEVKDIFVDTDLGLISDRTELGLNVIVVRAHCCLTDRATSRGSRWLQASLDVEDHLLLLISASGELLQLGRGRLFDEGQSLDLLLEVLSVFLFDVGLKL